MLVIKPRFNEKVYIGDDIVVEIYPKNNKIVLAIDAPDDIPIVREFAHKKQRSNADNKEQK